MKIMQYKQKDDSILRCSNVELCRILAMLFIVMSHTYELGMGAWSWSYVNGIAYSTTIIPQTFIASFFYSGVNVFLLISGYFLIKPTIRKFLCLYIVVAFYTLLGLLFHQFQTGSLNIISIIVQTIFPFGKLGGGYWFVECYLYLFLFAPFLNAAIEKMTNSQFLCSLMSLGIIDIYFGFFWQRSVVDGSGYCFIHFLFMYVLGQFLKKYQRMIDNGKHTKILALITFCVCSLTLFLMFYLIPHIPSLTIRTHNYSNPFSILGAVSLFVFVTQYKFNSPFINMIATTTFGIYLFQGNRYFIHYLYDTLQPWTQSGLATTFVIGLVLFMLGVIVERCLQYIYKPLTLQAISLFEKLYYKKHKI